MKLIKTLGLPALALCVLGMGMTGCSSMTNTGKGALIGGGGGAGLGAGLGAIIGGGKGAAIGSAIGAAVGAGAGVLIGQKMDKQQKELQEQLAQQAKVEQTTDANGLQAIKVTFDGGILFPTNGTTLSANAKADLSKFAQSLNSNPNTNVQIYGYTDDTGTLAVNQCRRRAQLPAQLGRSSHPSVGRGSAHAGLHRLERHRRGPCPEPPRRDIYHRRPEDD